MIWTLLAFLVAFFVLRKWAWPAITEALDKRQHAIEESIDDRRARARRGAPSCSTSTASGCARRAPRPRRSSPARARRARSHERETARGGQGQARGAARADAPRHRGRDAPRDPGDPHRGRRPHDPGHREGDPQDARRGRSEAPRRGGARRARLQLARRGAPELAHGRDRPGLRAVAVRGRHRARQARRRARAARRSSPMRWTRSRELQMFFFSPYFSTEEKEDGLHKAVTGADEAVVNFLVAAAGEPPHAGDLPRAPRVRPPVARRPTSSCRSRSRAPSSSIRRSPSASATRSAVRRGVPWS